jgi:hypothetical protein
VGALREEVIFLMHFGKLPYIYLHIRLDISVKILMVRIIFLPGAHAVPGSQVELGC